MEFKQTLISIMALLIISILFFPQDKTSYIWIPLLIAGVLGIVYLKIK